MDVVNEIKNRADIAELIGQYTALSRSGKTLKGLCPFHSEKHGSFFVYPESGTWHCFGACATGGDVFAFVMKKEGLTFSEALEKLAEKYGVLLPSHYAPSPETDHRSSLYAVNASAAQYFHDLLLGSPVAGKARAYLEKRGVNSKSIADFQLGYALPEWQGLKDHLNKIGHSDEVLLEVGLLGRADSGRTYDRFRDQIIFPIAEVRGRIYGFGARVLDDSLPKYLNSPETPLFSKSATLYGINLASSAIRQADVAVIVEGYLDVIISHQYGFLNTVASMGTAINEKHLAVLKKLSPNLILALDADAAGEEATARCVPFENMLEREIKVAVAPPGKDPDEVIKASAAVWRSLLDNATPIVDFVIEKAAASVNLRTARGKAELAVRLLPVIVDIKDPVRRAHYLSALASRVGTSAIELQYNLSQLKLPHTAVKHGAAPADRAGTSSSIEEYLLALLIKHPELKTACGGFREELFDSIENREIFSLCRSCDDPSGLKEKLDPAIWEQFDRVSAITIGDKRLSERLAECALRLEERFLKNTAVKINEILSTENDGGSSEELIKFQEQGLALDRRLAELFKRKEELRRSTGRQA